MESWMALKMWFAFLIGAVLLIGSGAVTRALDRLRNAGRSDTGRILDEFLYQE
jgi:hypothetical protein